MSLFKKKELNSNLSHFAMEIVFSKNFSFFLKNIQFCHSLLLVAFFCLKNFTSDP